MKSLFAFFFWRKRRFTKEVGWSIIWEDVTMKDKIMKIKVEKEANNVAKLEIEIPAKEAVDAYNRAVQKVSEYVNIPGFRKGKAPRNMVEQHVGTDRIKHEALERLLPKVFQEAIEKNELDVVSQPYVESYDFEVGKDVKISAKVELRPEVTLGGYKNLTVKAEEYENPEDSFDKALEGLMQKHATFNVVVDRKTKATDIVVMDFDGSVNGEKIRGGAAENYSLDLGNSNFIPGFAEQLVGHKLDEEFDITVEFPKDYHDEKLAGQPAVFKIKLKEIKEKVLPELNDEFAQKVGSFKTVAELKADIQTFLDTTKKNEDKKSAENAIFDEVINNVKVEIPESMIEREMSSLLEEYKQRLASQGYKWEDFIKSHEKDELFAEMRKEATLRIKNSLVIDKIALVEEIKVEKEDFEKKVEEMEKMYHMGKGQILEQMKQNPGIFSTISQQVLNQKVVEFLAENNKVEYTKKKAAKTKAK